VNSRRSSQSEYIKQNRMGEQGLEVTATNMEYRHEPNALNNVDETKRKGEKFRTRGLEDI